MRPRATGRPKAPQRTIARPAVLAALVVSSLSLALVPAAATETLEGHYDVGSSVVIRGIFGFGVLLCASERAPEVLLETASNGGCLPYGGLEGEPFVATLTDDDFDATGFTAAVDLNGDGCVSTSCEGVPNDRDFRSSSCNSISGVLPTPDEGVASVLQFHVRIVDLNADTLETCFASGGQITAIAG